MIYNGLWKSETGNCLMLLKHERGYGLKYEREYGKLPKNTFTRMTCKVISGKYDGAELISVMPKRRTRLVVLDTEAGMEIIYVRQGGTW